MDKMIYTAMTGANAAQYRQQVLANNLANVSTAGFRAELSTFRAVPVRGDGSTTRVFALEATAGHLDTPGPINPTGRSLDVAAKGDAYFAVQGLDGTEAYTRAGAFEVSADGTLVSAQGLPVLSDGGAPIVVHRQQFRAAALRAAVELDAKHGDAVQAEADHAWGVAGTELEDRALGPFFDLAFTRARIVEVAIEVVIAQGQAGLCVFEEATGFGVDRGTQGKGDCTAEQGPGREGEDSHYCCIPGG